MRASAARYWASPVYVVPDRFPEPDCGKRLVTPRAAWLKGGSPSQVTNATAIAFVVLVAANLLSVIAEAGFHWDLPSDPVGYLLFK
jgi:hypothetical protein